MTQLYELPVRAAGSAVNRSTGAESDSISNPHADAVDTEMDTDDISQAKEAQSIFQYHVYSCPDQHDIGLEDRPMYCDRCNNNEDEDEELSESEMCECMRDEYQYVSEDEDSDDDNDDDDDEMVEGPMAGANAGASAKDGGRVLQSSDMEDLGWRAINSMVGTNFLRLKVINEIVENLTGMALWEAVMRAMEPLKHANLRGERRVSYSINSKTSSSIWFRICAEVDEVTELGSSEVIWDFALQILSRRKHDEGWMRSLLSDIIRGLGISTAEVAINALAPEIWKLSQEKKLELAMEAMKNVEGY